MSADRFAEVERLYHEARTRPSQERAAFLDEACRGDDVLRQEVESLLALRTDPDGFLSRPALEEAARLSSRSPDSWPTIPGYTVRRVLGEGGMGVVYLAEQEQPFHRLVALKLIKPGMDTRQVVARFETERQALALMDHPNIAAVFDAGSTTDGRPYFVMEYVDGAALTDYCDRQRLSTRDRLALFVQVCAAVQHAHQKGVIHRDLKPSNVLVAERDGRAVPKVIDFGTAKAVSGAWNVTATQFGQGMVLGTLEYMSPEQAALSADIDTATDVYSLGVLLYELLVGRLPFDTEELRAAGYDEMRRVIRESDPPKPSVRVEQRSDQSGAVARARQTDAPGLTRQLRGDLDWITLKALEKDRRRRYATVAEFAADIGRFLADQPVEARPPSSAYRIRKFTRRHRLVVAAVASILTILGAGVAATAALYWQAEQSRREAEQQREQAIAQGRAADRAAAEANEQRTKAVAAQKDAEIQRQKAESAAEKAQTALNESTYLAYTATLAAAAGDLRNDAAPEARARLLKVPEAQRGWEWQHLFIQADESVLSFSSAAPPCPWNPYRSSTTALSLDADGQSILLRRCLTLERWNVTTLTHTAMSAPKGARGILAENSRGQVLSVGGDEPRPERPRTGPDSSPTESHRYHLVLTDRTGSAAGVTFGPFDRNPICAGISADGTRIALGLAEVTEASDQDVFEVWNAATGRLEFRLVGEPPAPTPGQFSQNMSRWCHVQFSRDGRKVATSGIRVAVWDAVTGIARVTDSLKTGGFPQPIDFSPESDRLAIGRPNGRVDVLDLGQSSPTLRRLAVAGSLVEESAPDDADPVISSRRRVVLAVAFSPDGQTVISGSSTHVGVWDIRQSRRVRVLSGHGGDAIDVALSADGRRIYSVDTSGVVRVWPLSTTSAVIRTPGSFVNMVPLRANADGSIIATVTSDQALTTIRLTHLTDLHQDVINTPARSLSNVPRFGPMAVSPDGLHLFELQGRSIRRWTVKSEQPVVVSRSENLNCTGRDATSSLTVSRGGSLLAFNHRNCVFVWDASTMKQLGVFTADTASIATDMVFRDEDTLIISTQDPARKTPSVIRVWNWRTNQVLRRVVPRPVVGQDTVSWWLTLSPDARRIALISRGPGLSIVSLWDGDLKVEVGRLPPGDFLALAFSADGRRIVSVSAQEIAVRVWDAERFRLLLTLPDTDTHSGGVAFTRAGQIVAGRTGGGLTIWETQIRRQ